MLQQGIVKVSQHSPETLSRQTLGPVANFCGNPSFEDYWFWLDAATFSHFTKSNIYPVLVDSETL